MKIRFPSILLLAAYFFLGATLAVSAGTTVVNVGSAAELEDALRSATGGEEIRVAGGEYGALNLGAQYPSVVTISSADRRAPATFSSVRLEGTKNITFDGVVFRYTYTRGDDTSTRKFVIADSRNVTIRNGALIGDNHSAGYPTAWGLVVVDSSDIAIKNMKVATWEIGVKLLDSRNVTISGSEIWNISGDGLQVNSVQGILVDGNYIHDFVADPKSPVHQDMIQFFSGEWNTVPSADVTIRNNTFDVGRGAVTQTIFMRNEQVDNGHAGKEMYYRRFVIENNVIYNAHLHGITVGETDGLTIRNNTVIRAALSGKASGNKDLSGDVSIPRIVVAEGSTSVKIQNNVAAAVPRKVRGDWTVSGNAIIQDTNPRSGGFYDSVFVYHATGPRDGYNQYGVVPGSLVDRMNAGSSLVDQYPKAPG